MQSGCRTWRYQAVIGSVTADAGLMMDRARYLREIGWDSPARDLFARQHTFAYRPADVDRFLEMMLLLAGAATDAGQYTTAYNIARQLDDVLPAGTDLTRQPYGVRDKYTSLAWLAGSASYGGLRNPSNAIAMFERYSRGRRSAQVATKGSIGLGAQRHPPAGWRRPTAILAARRLSQTFYGLALERLGRSVTQSAADFRGVPAQRADFNNRSLVQATRRMASFGALSAACCRALGRSLTNDGERTLAVEFGQQIGRPDVPVWVARARNDSGAFYVRRPIHHCPCRSLVPSGLSPMASPVRLLRPLCRGHAGARGMMQLMPGTAREQAGKLGVGYDPSRQPTTPITTSCSAGLFSLLNTWDGSIPLAVASYNAGAGNVLKWINLYGDRGARCGRVGLDRAIPFTETKGYVQRVIENSVV